MKKQNYEKMLLVAKKAALNANKIIRSNSGNKQHVDKKISKFDIVTKADLQSEKEILRIIRKNFPNHNILSEEKGFLDKHSSYTWAIDPLDGTSLYTSSIPQYCVAIGLLKDNKPYLGVISRIKTNEVYWAIKGHGAFKNEVSISVSNVSSYSKAIIGSDYQNTKEMRLKDHERNGKLMIEAKTFRTGAGSCSSLADLAEGRLGGFVHKCRPWDFVAGAAILLEAGGKATDWQGNAIDWKKKWIEGAFSNGLLHSKIIKILNTNNI